MDKKDLHDLFVQKYGSPEQTGWSPRRRYRFGYYLPGDIYEAYIKTFITESTTWIDVGGGSAIFPNNPDLSLQLSEKCKKMVAVDPSENVYDNVYADEKHCKLFEDFQTDEKFDLATFNMVAEHISDPDKVLKKLDEIMNPEGVVIIYTINRFSPIPIITYLLPFSLHYKIKKIFWGGEEKDTFPVAYKMNTRKTLKNLFEKYDFVEHDFKYLDDLSTSLRFNFFSFFELTVWKFLNFFHIRYPEFNLLGTYKRNSRSPKDQ